jgi:hypothetical protein
MPYERSAVTMARNSKTLTSKPFAMTWVLNISFRVCIHLPRMAWWKGKGGIANLAPKLSRHAQIGI